MKFRLSDWASLAEIIASVAVVITLILLMFDVRENTEVVRANSYDDLLSDINDQSFVVVQDERLLGIWQRYNEGKIDELTQAEHFTLITLLRATFRTFEKAFFAYQYGTVGATEYARFDAQTCNHFDMIGQRSWGDINSVLTEDFRSHVEDLCAGATASGSGK